MYIPGPESLWLTFMLNYSLPRPNLSRLSVKAVAFASVIYTVQGLPSNNIKHNYLYPGNCSWEWGVAQERQHNGVSGYFSFERYSPFAINWIGLWFNHSFLRTSGTHSITLSSNQSHYTGNSHALWSLPEIRASLRQTELGESKILILGCRRRIQLQYVVSEHLHVSCANYIHTLYIYHTSTSILVCL